jgi:hypothetical protein
VNADVSDGWRDGARALIAYAIYGSAKTFDIFTSLVDYRISTTTCYNNFFADEHLADTGASFVRRLRIRNGNV